MLLGKETDPWYFKQDGKPPQDQMTYISVQINKPCDRDCLFCYVDGSNPGDMPLEFFSKIIEEASNMGLQRVQISGGEPTLSKNLFDYIDYLRKRDIEVLMPTHGGRITPEIAKRLHDYQVNVGVSFESIDPRIDDYLTNVAGSWERKVKGIDNLREAGYTDNVPLNIITKTFKQNYQTFINTWKWAKSLGIQPILDHAIPGDRCKIEWMITGKELRRLLDEIEKIEGKKFHLPWVDNEACNRLSTGVHVDLEGSVYPCSGLYFSAGNMREMSLSEIWTTSPVLQICRNANENLQGSCGSCESKKECYGCRAVAYAVFNDLSAPDPSCWKFESDSKYRFSIPNFDYAHFERELEIVDRVRTEALREGRLISLAPYRESSLGRIATDGSPRNLLRVLRN